MTDDQRFELTRRKALAGLGGIGVASAGAGFGTTAYFSDTEEFEGNTLTAGTVELNVTWQQLYYGGPQGEAYGTAGRPFVNAHPDDNGDGVQSWDGDAYASQEDIDEDPEAAAKEGKNLEFACDDFEDDDWPEPSFDPNENALIELDDVKPGDCGEVTFGVKVCDNPSWVWLGGELVEESDGGHPESDGAQLADSIFARVWYDLDGDNVYDEGEPQIAAGTLSSVLDELRSGIQLAFDPRDEAVPDPDETTLAEIDDDDCVPLPKEDDADDIEGLSEGDTFEYDEDAAGNEIDPPVEIEITNVYFEDGEQVGFDWESNYGICQVRVRGGPPGEDDPPGEGPATVFDCATSGTVFAPENDDNPNRQFYRISNFRFYYCPDVKEEPPGECFEPSNTRFIAFEWCLPPSVGNEVQGDSVSFDLQFYAEQCRHNDDPQNPFAEVDEEV